MHYSTSLFVSSLSLLSLATCSIASPIFLKRGYEGGGGLNGLSRLGDILGLGGGSTPISPSFLSTLDLSKLSEAQRAQLFSALQHSTSSKDKVKFNEKDFNELKAKNRLKINEDDNERNLNQEEREKLRKELEEKEKEGRGGGLRKRTFGDFDGGGGRGYEGRIGGFGGFGGGGESEYGSGFEEGRFEEIGRGQGFESGGGGLYDGGLFDGGLYDAGEGRGGCGGFECKSIDKRGGEEFDGSLYDNNDINNLGGYFDQFGRFHKFKLSQDSDRILNANDRSHHLDFDKDQAIDSKKYNEVNFEKENENKDEDSAKLAIDLEKLREEEELRKKEKEEGGGEGGGGGLF